MLFKKKNTYVEEYYEAERIDMLLDVRIKITKDMIHMYERELLRRPDDSTSQTNKSRLADYRAELYVLEEFKNSLPKKKVKIRIKD